MRRLPVLVAVLVLVDTMLYAALTPLLPHFAHEFALSKTRAGVLVAAYAAGALLGGLPGGLAAARLGAKRSVLAGLTLMGLSSLGFAFAGGFWALFAARLIQGGGSAFTWAGAFAWLLGTAPRERRGEMIGTAMGAAVFGAMLGPAIGAAAAIAGRAPVFVALSGLALVLAAWALRLEDSAAQQPSLSALVRALRNGEFAGGLFLMALASLLFGILGVLGPLHLAAAGWGAAAIGAVWLAGGALETLQAPLVGRLIDARGRLLPIRASLALATAVTVGLAFGARPLAYVPLLVLASLSYGALFTPAFVLIADGSETAGLAQGMGFGLMNAAWALGAVAGPGAAGAIAAASGDWLSFALGAFACFATLLALLYRARVGASSAVVPLS